MKVELRRATEDDYELMLKWRNDPDLMQWFYSQKDGHTITWEEHLAWLRSRNKDFHIYIIYAGDDVMQKVGVFVVGQLDYWEPEMACYIGEKSFWGKNISDLATEQILNMLRSTGHEYVRITIMDNNLRAIKACTSQGYEKIGVARPGESLYRLKLNNFVKKK
jgi:RimJ/RimL family protein N-acetyltransferase